MRTLAALLLVVGAGALAAYAFQRPTIARGDIVAADLLATNPSCGWRAMTCDPEIPIGVHGARFSCAVELRGGDRVSVGFAIDEKGEYRALSVQPARELCK